MEQEQKIIRYALAYLQENLEGDVEDKLGKILETNDPNEIDYILNDLIENY